MSAYVRSCKVHFACSVMPWSTKFQMPLHNAAHAKRLKMFHVDARKPSRDGYSSQNMLTALPGLLLLQSHC